MNHRSIITIVLLLLAGVIAGGCGRPEPIEIRVIYSTDIRGWIEPCT